MKSHKAKIAERLRKARDELGLTQTELAKIAGISRSALVHYETGGTVPGGLELIKLSNTLKVTPNYLLSGSETFLESNKPEHILATDNQELLIARMSICFMALDKPVRENMSELLISMVQQKLSAEEFPVLMTFMDELGSTLKGDSPEMEKVIETMFPNTDFPKTTQKAEELGVDQDKETK
jgi:transcriptional regulator with XRE-family HTH domain